MQHLQHLLGIDFEEGWQDCYSLARVYYKDLMGLELKDYARPSQWYMMPGFNFFDRLFPAEGFIQATTNANDVMIGDALLMAMGRTETSNHVAIYVGKGMILHHLTGQKSRLDPYNLKWRERVTRVLRHPSYEMSFETLTMETLAQLPFAVRQRLSKRNPA